MKQTTMLHLGSLRGVNYGFFQDRTPVFLAVEVSFNVVCEEI